MTRTERAAKYYDEQLNKPYPKYIEHPSFHLLGVLLDRMELNDVEVTSEALADLKDDGIINSSTSPYKSTTNDPFAGV